MNNDKNIHESVNHTYNNDYDNDDNDNERLGEEKIFENFPVSLETLSPPGPLIEPIRSKYKSYFNFQQIFKLLIKKIIVDEHSN